MLEFPSARNDWRLDVVSILAVLGESNIKVNAHLITAAWTCLLPRLMPAPQGMLAEKRMKYMPVEDDVSTCVGVQSGNMREGLSYFATLLHGPSLQCDPFTVQEMTIRPNQDRNKRLKALVAARKQNLRDDISLQDMNPLGKSSRVRSSSLEPPEPPQLNPKVNIRPLNPMKITAVVSCAISVGLLVWAAIMRDGVAVLGIIVMSLATPLLCASSRYQLLDHGRPMSKASPGDIVLRTRNGSFIVIHCDESIARPLYFGPQKPQYTMNLRANRLSGGVIGGLMLITSITLFGNCSWTMQAALLVTYVILNVAYWVAAIRPEWESWDLSDFEITDTRTYENRTFTEALWRAIYASQSVAWVPASWPTASSTATWRAWLVEAERNLHNDSWDSWEVWRRIYEAKKLANGTQTV